MSDEQNVKGLSDLQRFLDTFPVKVEKNVMRGAMRAGMKVVQPAAKDGINSVSSLLADGLKVSTVSRGSMVIARLRATGKHGSLAHLVEFGTAAHLIASKLGKYLAFSGTFIKAVKHPGARAKAFMRPALDSNSGAAVVASGNYIKNRLATKHGLDVSHIEIES